jgi:hypothetical protein
MQAETALRRSRSAREGSVAIEKVRQEHAVAVLGDVLRHLEERVAHREAVHVEEDAGPARSIPRREDMRIGEAVARLDLDSGASHAQRVAGLGPARQPRVSSAQLSSAQLTIRSEPFTTP